jgi:hypothetical protein
METLSDGAKECGSLFVRPKRTISNYGETGIEPQFDRSRKIRDAR